MGPGRNCRNDRPRTRRAEEIASRRELSVLLLVTHDLTNRHERTSMLNASWSTASKTNAAIIYQSEQFCTVVVACPVHVLSNVGRFRIPPPLAPRGVPACSMRMRKKSPALRGSFPCACPKSNAANNLSE